MRLCMRIKHNFKSQRFIVPTPNHLYPRSFELSVLYGNKVSSKINSSTVAWTKYHAEVSKYLRYHRISVILLIRWHFLSDRAASRAASSHLLRHTTTIHTFVKQSIEYPVQFFVIRSDMYHNVLFIWAGLQRRLKERYSSTKDYDIMFEVPKDPKATSNDLLTLLIYRPLWLIC